MKMMTFEQPESDLSDYLQEFEEGSESISIIKDALPQGNDFDVAFTSEKVLILEGNNAYVLMPDKAIEV